MDEATAKAVIDHAIDAENRLNEALRVIKDRVTEEEFKRRHPAIAMLIGRIFTDIVRPLYQEHPELAPENIRPSLSPAKK